MYADLGTSEQILYDLLLERDPEHVISHVPGTTFTEHKEFVRSKPYKAWYLIAFIDENSEENENAGAIYLTDAREVGIFVFRSWQGQGVGSMALADLSRRQKGPLYANINPANEGSVRFFTRHGFAHIQNTYRHD